MSQTAWTSASPTPVDLQVAANAQTAAAAVYFKNDTFKGERKLPEGWQEVKHDDDHIGPLLQQARGAHLIAPNGAHFIAFRGSTGSKITDSSWQENYKQGLGLHNIADTPRHAAAAEIGRQFRNEPVTFTGHSLGGGLATLAAETASSPNKSGVVPKPARLISFNAAKVHKNTFDREGCSSRGKTAESHHLCTTDDCVNRYVPGGKLHTFTGEIDESKNKGGREVYVVKDDRKRGHGIADFKTDPKDKNSTFSLPINGATGPLTHKEFDQKIASRVADASLGKRLELARGPITIGSRSMGHDR